MNTRVATILAAAGLALMGASLAHAQATRTWVSAEGSDSNAGTRSAPFATFNTAVANTAAGGTVSVVDPGDYGAVTISKAITIDGGGVQGSITFTGGEGIYVAAGVADTVILRHLSINGAGVGTDAIFLTSAATLVIEDCSLYGFTSIGIGVGSSGAQNVSVKNTTIVGGTLGVRVFQGPGPVSVALENVTITGATSAAIFTRSGVLQVGNSTLMGNAVALENDTNADIAAWNDLIAQNQTAILTYAGSKTHISSVEMVDNNIGIAVAGGSIVSTGNNVGGNNTTLGVPTLVKSTF